MPKFCRCGTRFRAGLRIGPALGQVTRVACCWQCGAEHPSLYGRPGNERNGGSKSDYREQWRRR